MQYIKISATGKYIPNRKIDNEELNKKFNLPQGWIEKRSGIKARYYSDEDIIQMAIHAVENLIVKSNIDINKIEQIYVATTSSKNLMPGISFEIQKNFNIRNCICLDILGGCSGFINAFDIAQKYIASGNKTNALIIGVDKLSEFVMDDINTSILLGDGAGAIYIEKTSNLKKYESYIESIGEKNEILTCNHLDGIIMNGKEVYKFATTKTIKNVQEVLKLANMSIKDIDFIIPHQSNMRILKSIEEKLKCNNNQMFINLEHIGNTFNASIPIALNEMIEKNILKECQKILMIGYGGGLNLGSIIFEM